MYRTLKTSVVAIAVAGGAAVGLGSLAAASYGDEPPTIDESTGDATTDEASDAVDDVDDVTTAVEPNALQDAAIDGEQAEAASEGRRRGGCGGNEAVAEALGLTTDELRAAKAEGQSLADIAVEQGVAVDSVVDAIVDGIEEHLAEEVAEGDLTQEEADERLASAEERAIEKVESTPGDGAGLRGFGGRRGPAPAPADA